MTKVSAIIPVYNGEKYIEDAIRSVLTQTFSDLELIIVDDGSTDKTGEICKGFLSDSRVKYIYQENQGVSSARNTGIKRSNGEYVAFLDADDYWLPDKTEEQIKFLKIHKEFGMVHCGIYLLNARGEKIGVDIGKNASDNMAYDLLVKGNCVSCSTVFVRRACLEDVGLFDPDLFTAEDLDLWIRIARRYKIFCVKKVLSFGRVLSDGLQRNIHKSEHGVEVLLNKYLDSDIFNFTQKEKNFIRSIKYVSISRAYFKNMEYMDFIRTGSMALFYYPKNIYRIFALPKALKKIGIFTKTYDHQN